MDKSMGIISATNATGEFNKFTYTATLGTGYYQNNIKQLGRVSFGEWSIQYKTNSRVSFGFDVVSRDVRPPVRISLSADLDPALYRVWVRVAGGAWSRSVDFEVQPDLVGPVTPVIETRPQFEWEAIPGATGYQIFIRTVTTRSATTETSLLTTSQRIS